MLYELFEELGFSNKEATVYKSLLELGPAKVSEISAKSKINRTTLYDILEALAKKGFLSKFRKRKTHYFQALDPRQLLAYIDDETNEVVKTAERRKARVQQLLPELLSLQSSTTAEPKVRFFLGERGIRAAQKGTLKAKSTMLAYSNIEAMTNLLPNFMPEYWKERVKRKLFAKEIFTDNPDSRKRAGVNQQELRVTKFLPKDVAFSSEVKIFDDKTLITLWEEQMAVRIESKEYADMQTKIFNLLWETLK